MSKDGGVKSHKGRHDDEEEEWTDIEEGESGMKQPQKKIVDTDALQDDADSSSTSFSSTTSDEDEDEEGEEEVEPEEEKVDEVLLQRMKAKEERQQRRETRPQPEEVEGATPIKDLRELSLESLYELVDNTRYEVRQLKTENFLYERTIERLEEPERLLEIQFAERLQKQEQSQSLNPANALCPSESEDDDQEDDENSQYSAIVPINEIEVSQDSFFDNMSDNSKEAALNYFRNIGTIAPPNYDVIKDKYREYMKGSKEDPEFSKRTADVMKPTRLSEKVFKKGLDLLEKRKAKATGEAKRKTAVMLTPIWISENDEKSVEDEESVDYGEFTPSEAKELKIKDKLKFALQCEAELRKQFYEYEKRTIKEEGISDVNIESHKHSVQVLKQMETDLKTMIADTVAGPLNAKTMGDSIIRMRRKIRNAISAEETKMKTEIRKIMQVNQRTMYQLKSYKTSGSTISEVDVQYLEAENEIYTNDMNELMTILIYLKELSNKLFRILLKDKQRLETLRIKEAEKVNQIFRKREFLIEFEATYKKYRSQINKLKSRVSQLKHKASEFHAPEPYDYIRLKAAHYRKQELIKQLHKRLEALDLRLITAKTNFTKMCGQLPKGDQIEEDNRGWLDEIQDEVKANRLPANFMDHDSSDDDNKEEPQSQSAKRLSLPHAHGPNYGRRSLLSASIRTSQTQTTASQNQDPITQNKKSFLVLMKKNVPLTDKNQQKVRDKKKSDEAKAKKVTPNAQSILLDADFSHALEPEPTVYDMDMEFYLKHSEI